MKLWNNKRQYRMPYIFGKALYKDLVRFGMLLKAEHWLKIMQRSKRGNKLFMNEYEDLCSHIFNNLLCKIEREK